MENGEQKIFVWCDFTETMDDAVLHGSVIAKTLKKGLCLLHNLDPKHHENKEMAEARLCGIAEKAAHLLPNNTVKYIVLDLGIIKALSNLADLYECLALVAHKTTAPKLLSYLQYASFPFLFVSAKSNIDKLYRRVVVPVGYMKKSKDLALWASYLGRHNGATVDFFVAEEGSTADNINVKKNVASIAQLYDRLKFPFRIIESHSPTWKLQRAALYHALGLKSGMLIIAVSFNTTFLDSMLGLTERKVIEKSGELSVMCVNSRREFYTYCC